MKRLYLPTCLLAIATCPLFAQQGPVAQRRPPSSEQVTKFFEVMHLHDQMQTMLQTEQKQMNVIFTDMFNKEKPQATSEERTKFQNLINTVMGDLFASYPIEDVLRDMVPVYQNHLSESDLTQIIAFYASPVGQKVLKEMPVMTAEAMRVSYARLQPKIDEMMKKIDHQIKAMAATEKAAPVSDTNSAAPESAHPQN
jgi:hypothetical protein